MMTEEKVVFIEELKDEANVWRTRRVMVKSRGLIEYDVDWCRRDQVSYYEQSGGGPDKGTVYIHQMADVGGARVWVAPGYVCTNGGTTNDTPVDPTLFGYTVLTEFPGDPFQGAVQEDCKYCSICEDYLPDDDLCGHVWFCADQGWYSGPGFEGGEGPCGASYCEGCSSRIGKLSEDT